MEKRGIKRVSHDVEHLWRACKNEATKSARLGEDPSPCLQQRPTQVQEPPRREFNDTGSNNENALRRSRSPGIFLIIDDEEDDFVLFERALKKVKVRASVCWAQDGVEAVTTLSRISSQFSSICLIVDVQLREMSGFELVEDLREKALCDNVILVFVTGNPNPVLRARAFAAGAEAFFLKPCDDSAFLKMAHDLDALCKKVAVD